MRRLWRMAAVLALVGAPLAQAAEVVDPARQAALGEDMKPFDSMQAQGWETAAVAFRSTPQDEPDAATFELKPGAYTIVAKCHCDQMDVTLVAPNANKLPPLRSSAQAAMFSLDVPAAGTYLAGVDMNLCQAKTCDFVVKVYRKK